MIGNLFFSPKILSDEVTNFTANLLLTFYLYTDCSVHVTTYRFLKGF